MTPTLNTAYIRASMLSAVLKSLERLQAAVSATATAATTPAFVAPAPTPGKPGPYIDVYSTDRISTYLDLYYFFTIHLRRHLRAGEIALFGHSPSFPTAALTGAETRSELAKLVDQGRAHESLKAVWNEYDRLVAVPAPELWAWALLTGERITGYEQLVEGLRTRHGLGPEDDLLGLGGIVSAGEVVENDEEEKEIEETWGMYETVDWP
ncbi:hypothetical protein EDC01DRAFT_782595 [Geopyxis carbonaria]|nr:hypothetical protein EDC01DRAFT_782595 [Geopyxis carbonaria]